MRLTPRVAGFRSEYPAGFKLECMAGFVGTRSLALLISEQTFQEQTCIRRNTLLPEQRTYPLLNLSNRRRPQRKRLLNRRCPRPRSPNHGCP